MNPLIATALRARAERGGDHPLEERDLRALVPLGMVEEREVEHRDRGRDGESHRQRVVRTVPHVGSDPFGERGRAELLPREPCRSTLGDLGVDHGLRRDVDPTRRVAAAGEQVELEIGAGAQAAGELDRVHARADGSSRNRRDIKEQAHEAAVYERVARSMAVVYALWWAWADAAHANPAAAARRADPAR